MATTSLALPGPTPSCALGRAPLRRLTRIRAPSRERARARVRGFLATTPAGREARDQYFTGGTASAKRAANRWECGTEPFHPQEAEKARDATPPYLSGNYPFIVLWPRPPLGPLFGSSPSVYWLQVTPLFYLPIPIGSSYILSSPCFLLAQATPSHLSPDPSFSLSSSPSHLSFILHVELGV